jgi:hypothetical protein
MQFPQLPNLVIQQVISYSKLVDLTVLQSSRYLACFLRIREI